MEFNINQLKDTDYEDVLIGWWNDWGWKAPKKEFLPENGTGGIMICDGDTPICAGFLYITNSSVAWVDWIISSKTYRKKPQRQQAIELLIDTLTNIARNSGNKYTYALIKNKNLIDTYKNVGYVQGDSYTSEMIKTL